MLYKKEANNRIIQANSFYELFSINPKEKEHWLFISPHDDDVIIGASLIIQQALKDNIDITVLVVTDGRMGYCDYEQRHRISEIRKEETEQAFNSLGISSTVWLDFPDGNLSSYIGRREAASGDPCRIVDHTSLENAFTFWLRKVRPQRVFVPTENDLHTDHKITHQQLLISLFHAQGDIWPELGESLNAIPVLYELAVYCDFSAPPQYLIKAEEDSFQKKIKAIAAFKSQKQIQSLVENAKKGGPVEYIYQPEFKLYSAQNYKDLFTIV